MSKKFEHSRIKDKQRPRETQETIISMEKGNVENYREMLQNGKRLIRIADREEDGRELVKCFCLMTLL